MTDLRSFLGLYIAFRWFDPTFDVIVVQLQRELQKDQPSESELLIGEEKKAVKPIEKKQITPTVLPLPYTKGHYTKDIEACNLQVGVASL